MKLTPLKNLFTPGRFESVMVLYDLMRFKTNLKLPLHRIRIVMRHVVNYHAMFEEIK